jgi:hypothetical protein
MEEKIIADLHETIRRSWSADTSADADSWTVSNPSWGQCAVTACVVQDAVGGEIVWAAATTPDGKQHSHYFNRLPSGKILDLTREQFPLDTDMLPPDGTARTAGTTGGSFASTREYILSFAVTKRRYELLRAKLKQSQQLAEDGPPV